MRLFGFVCELEQEKILRFIEVAKSLLLLKRILGKTINNRNGSKFEKKGASSVISFSTILATSVEHKQFVYIKQTD